MYRFVPTAFSFCSTSRNVIFPARERSVYSLMIELFTLLSPYARRSLPRVVMFQSFASRSRRIIFIKSIFCLAVSELKKAITWLQVGYEFALESRRGRIRSCATVVQSMYSNGTQTLERQPNRTARCMPRTRSVIIYLIRYIQPRYIPNKIFFLANYTLYGIMQI